MIPHFFTWTGFCRLTKNCNMQYAIHSASSEAKEFLVHGKFIEQTGKMSIKNVIKKSEIKSKPKKRKITLNSGKH